jgi:serine/threonine-protein kinase
MIGTFLLEEAIGAGGMGAVFRALDTQLDRQVALKLLPPDQAVDPEVVQRFYQEGRSAAQLDHENIARVFSIGQDGLFHHIAFEYIEGMTLRHRVESTGPLKPGEAVDVALQIANALVHASRRSVVHRDIKPSNIILTPQGRAKVVDMGLARRFERGGDHGLTQSGMTLGTFDYISPEQARDPRDVDVRSDLYSLGCTMFHMLTGRPPFPGGTVLQKLIQHQEEPPADVRTLNPEVPAELSAIIARLMAKERDRRYQTPEQLVRDLLTLAGSLGLEPTGAELEPWMVHAHHTWWERHLVWLLPALGFVVVISGLAWWGREFSKPPAAAAGLAGGVSQRANAELKIAESAGPEIRAVAPESASGESERVPAPSYPQTIPVSSTEDLQAVIASAPRRSIIVLADDGPYRMGGKAWSSRHPRPSAEPDLTIKAEAGVRPVLKRAEGVRSDDGRSPSLLPFVGGHVVIEGVEFELDATGSGEPASAISSEDTELVLRGCSFRRPDRVARGDREAAAVLVRASRPGLRGAERPPAVFADYCHFDGGQTAIRAQGPADIALRDCTLGPAAPSIWFDDTRAERSVAGELRLIHTSILAGPGPVFRFDGGPVRARVDDCVIAAAGREPSALVLVQDPRNLGWRGRSNLFGSIAPFLETPPGSSQAATVADFAAWEQTSAEPRELGSQASELSVWDAVDPLLALTQERVNPTRVFLLGPRVGATSDVGARQGPFGSILKNVRMAQRTPATRPVEVAMNRAEAAKPADARPMPRTGPPARTDQARERPSRPPDGAPRSADPAPSTSTSASASASDPMSLPTMPPMSTPAEAVPDLEPEDETGLQPMPMPESSRAEVARVAPAAVATPLPSRSAPAAPTPEQDVIRSTEQLQAALRRLGDGGGTIRVGAGAELDLPTVVISLPSARRVQIVAEPRGVRPRLRFRPAPIPGTSPADWTALLNLRSGSLRLQGLDLIVPEPESAPAERLAAIAVLPGTELILDDCTVTLALRGAGATALAVQPPVGGPARKRSDDDDAPEAVIRIRDGFLRSGGDAVVVSGGSRLALTLEDVMVATEGSLLHALGTARKANAAPSRKVSLDVRIDRTCARVKGGLVHLQTTPEEPEMATVDIRAENSILNTVTGDHPLFRLEGQDQLDRLRDKIRWVGHKIAYHHIKTYRRDEIVQAGGLPRIYDRDDWTRAFLPTDDGAMLSDLKFRQQADATVPAWRVVREDLSLDANSTTGPLGPDAEKIPDPPAWDEEL